MSAEDTKGPPGDLHTLTHLAASNVPTLDVCCLTLRTEQYVSQEVHMTMDPTAAADQLPLYRTSSRHGTHALLDVCFLGVTYSAHHTLPKACLQSKRVLDKWSLSNLMSRSSRIWPSEYKGVACLIIFKSMPRQSVSFEILGN